MVMAHWTGKSHLERLQGDAPIPCLNCSGCGNGAPNGNLNGEDKGDRNRWMRRHAFSVDVRRVSNRADPIPWDHQNNSDSNGKNEHVMYPKMLQWLLRFTEGT